MKLQILIAVQVVLLLLVIIFGSILNTDLLSDVRTLHRGAASLSILIALFLAIALYRSKYGLTIKLVSAASFISVLLAGIFGSQTAGSANYSLMFNLMRLSGVIALLLAVYMLVFIIRARMTSRGSRKLSDEEQDARDDAKADR